MPVTGALMQGDMVMEPAHLAAMTPEQRLFYTPSAGESVNC